MLGVGLLTCAVHAEDQKASDKKAAFKDDKEKVSYAIGLSTGGNIKRNDLEVDVDAVVRGLKDGIAGQGLLSETEMREVFGNLNQQMRAKAEEKRKAEAEKNKKAGADFLAANKTKPGVITLPSGLQYKVITEGKGESPKSDDIVTVNYRGTLIDGTEFDSSYARNQPSSTPANHVIKGWTEALQLMKPGSKWQLFIPADLAYGDTPKPPKIQAGSTLIFEVELLSFKKPEAPAPSQPLTSDIIKVPSAEELKKGAKIETIKPEDIEKEKAKEKANQK
ncbi:FKBP-type peptidyl-prolyl isomerase domain protein [Pedosphaera parvula Ellin514]|uniref:Peptidyl-prolyl cis-trans isomerase n=2 Tax=Pedosphaera TaxID=1032526 RepID=B9XH65_PEDPL|nr:FKBP-type peptidyl-prolyl isomerase domain protein [Pedosphaera parvula Ellin514]